MVRYVGPIRFAYWRHAFRQGTTGGAISWVTRRRLINIELHYERRAA